MNQLIAIDGFAVCQDNSGRYCLNDLHRAAGGKNRHRPKYWLAQVQTQELVQELTKGEIPPLTGNQPVSVIHGGDNPGTYVCKELVYSYAMWISAAFNLKVIRTFDAIQTSQSATTAEDKIKAGILILESAAKMLNLSNSSKLAGYQTLQQFAGIPQLMPAYAIDAPADAVDGSSLPTKALSAILKENNIPVSPRKAYLRLQQLGIVERKQRPSSSAKAKNGMREFWSVTTKGLVYGKNVTSPQNPRETQPHFFDSKIKDLVELMMTANAA